MSEGLIIFCLICTALLCIPLIVSIVILIRQIVAIKKGKKYHSTYCFQTATGNLHVKWTDDEGIEHDRTFTLQPHLDLLYYSRRSNITETDIYGYKNMSSLGRTSVLGSLFMTGIIIIAVIYIWVYAIIRSSGS